MSRAFLRIVRRFATTTQLLEKWYSRVPPEKRKEIPLLSSLDQFKASLPVREIGGGIYKLHDQEVWARDEDIETMANELERMPVARSAVKYLAAPTQYGKSSFPLRAFLVSALRERKLEAPFQHYIYIAFSNNDNRHYKLFPFIPSSNSITAYKQGADFMLKCLDDAINNPSREGVRKIPRNDSPPGIEATQQAFKELFSKFSGRTLVHIDEHRHMCDRDEFTKAGVEFSCGAMGVLSQTPDVTVLATYTGVPPLPPQDSKTVCRDPVSVPALDGDAVMRAFPELASFQKRLEKRKGRLDGNQERLWASLRFRLALKLRTMPLSMVQVRDAVFKSFLEKFKIEAEKADLTKALIGCCQLCKVDFDIALSDKNATKLLVGVRDKNHEEFHRQATNLVVYNGLVTCDFKKLMELEDPNVDVYNRGRDLMMNSLQSEDVTAHGPLEAAYIWVLSVGSQMGRGLCDKHDFKCLKLTPARTFPKADSKTTHQDWLTKIAPEVFYYADEKSTHPLFDCWFRNSEGRVVLCDITGGMADKTKAEAIDKWIKEQPNTDEVLYGVVLAPNVEGPSTDFKPKDGQPSNVTIIRGAEAIAILGGLGQVLRWM